LKFGQILAIEKTSKKQLIKVAGLFISVLSVWVVIFKRAYNPSFIISYPDLIKFHYFARIPLQEEIGGESKGNRGETKGDFMDKSML
jgi:hypothetical protein